MPRPSQCGACGTFEHCLAPEDVHCAHREQTETREQKIARTQRVRDHTAAVAYEAAERATEARRRLTRTQRHHAEACARAQEAVAANISAHRGYPCNHFGKALDPANEEKGGDLDKLEP